MKALREMYLPNRKFTDNWRDCVPIVDSPNGIVGMFLVKHKPTKSNGVEMSVGLDEVAVECTMTDEEVGKKVLSMIEEFPEFEKMPYPEDYSKHPHCKSDEVWDHLQAQRASHRIAVVTRRGAGNVIFDNRIVLYIGRIYEAASEDIGFVSVDAGIAVAHHNGMYGIATIPNWKDYGVIIK